MEKIKHFLRGVTKAGNYGTAFINRRNRLLSWIELSLTILCALTAAYLGFSRSTQIVFRSSYIALIMFILFLLLVGLYLNYQNRYRASAHLFVLGSVLGPWGSLLIDQTIVDGNLLPLVYTSLSVFFSGLFLTTQSTLILGILQVIGLFFVRGWLFAQDIAGFSSLAFYYLFITTISIIFNHMGRKDQEIIGDQIHTLKHNQKKLKELSNRDTLTDLYNRRYLNATLPREFHRAERNKCNLAITIVDIDHFKQINDTFGHLAGDAILEKIAAIITNNYRKSDILCRYGGDEFLIVMPESSAEDAYRRTKALIHKIMHTDFSFESGEPIPVSLSFGISAYPDNGTDPKDVIAVADQALYLAKNNGRGRIEIAAATE